MQAGLARGGTLSAAAPAKGRLGLGPGFGFDEGPERAARVTRHRLAPERLATES